jgi:hypothetical protein
MPRVAAAEGREVTSRAQRALYFRCRRGEPEALAALLYSLVDRLYTAASYLLPDETSAVTTVAETWHRLLDLLQALHVGGHLARRAFALLGEKLAAYAPADQVRRALRQARDEADDGLLSFPAGDLQVLVDAVPLYALRIAESAGLRRVRARQALLFVTVFVATVAGYNIWRQGSVRSVASGVKLAALQAQVQRQDLATAVRDCVDELPDPEGANRYEARLLRQVGLVMEELANSQPGGGQALALLSRRVSQERLSDDLAELMSEREGMARKELARAHLVLEEVANL